MAWARAGLRRLPGRLMAAPAGRAGLYWAREGDRGQPGSVTAANRGTLGCWRVRGCCLGVELGGFGFVRWLRDQAHALEVGPGLW